MKERLRQAFVVLFLAICALTGSEMLKPRVKLADIRSQKVDLAGMIPLAFAGWSELRDQRGGIVDPVQQANLDRLYSQTVSRLYQGPNGERVMVSVAYGDDQRKYLALHYPEVCYPAQGFAVKSNQTDLLVLPTGTLPIRRLETFMTPDRREPVTYWTTLGDYSSLGGFPRRLLELRYGVQRLIPDGLLFRVSSIGADSAKQFAVQDRFIRDLLGSVPAQTRLLFTGEFRH